MPGSKKLVTSIETSSPCWAVFSLFSVASVSLFRFRIIYLVIFQTQEISAKTKSGRSRRGHLEKNIKYTVYMYVKIIVINKSIS